MKKKPLLAMTFSLSLGRDISLPAREKQEILKRDVSDHHKLLTCNRSRNETATIYTSKSGLAKSSQFKLRKTSSNFDLTLELSLNNSLKKTKQ